MILFNVDERFDGERLDVFVSQMLPDYSRSTVQSWIKKGSVTVSDAIAKSNYRVKEGDAVSVVIESVDMTIHPIAMPLDIVYEDDAMIIINKPRDLVVHPSPTTLDRPTLVHGLLAHTKTLSDINGDLRPGIVHRIDKDTSGLLVVAKTNEAHEALVAALKLHEIKREYVALTHHIFEHQSVLVDAPIGRDPRHRQRMAVTDINSKPAKTKMTLIETFGDYSYIRCELETGRTHQIRVHCKYIGHPLVGDVTYSYKNTPSIGGQWLHAYGLTLNHPITHELMHFEAPVPTELVEAMNALKEAE